MTHTANFSDYHKRIVNLKTNIFSDLHSATRDSNGNDIPYFQRLFITDRKWQKNISPEEEKIINQIVLDKQINILKLKQSKSEEAFEIYTHLDLRKAPEEYAARRIHMLKYKYHTLRDVVATDKLPQTGHHLNLEIKDLIRVSHMLSFQVPNHLRRDILAKADL